MPSERYEVDPELAKAQAALAKTGAALARWAKAEKQDALLKQFRSRLQGVCDTLPAGDAQRKTCEGVWAGKA